MRRLSILIWVAALVMLTAFSAGAANFANETLHYVISYKWGLIHKDAAEATLSLRNSGNSCNISLAARTRPWADKFFEVRDTLKATVLQENFRPKSYTKISHEGGRYSRDHIVYSFGGSSVKGDVTRHKQDKKTKKINVTTKTLASTGPTYDMLSVFYYLRLLNFDKLKKGTLYKVSIFSGSKVETLTIRMHGIETIKLRNKEKREAYRLSFTFTTGGKKKSSDDINTWISTDSSHIPLYLTGKLPLGEVRAYYIP